jgi:sialidase-1
MTDTSPTEQATQELEQFPLFTSGEDGYDAFRIPALVVSTQGTLLAFCEGRRHGRGDAGEIDLVLKHSSDGGQSWGPMQLAVSEPNMTCGNPCPVVDRSTGTLWLPFCKNLADGDENLITWGKAPRTVWITHSDDDGISWADPVEITASVKKSSWTWYATGPGHGIQLESGRLLIPCDHIVGIHFDRHRDPYHSHVIYSDDGGTNWQIGGSMVCLTSRPTNPASTAMAKLPGTMPAKSRPRCSGRWNPTVWTSRVCQHRTSPAPTSPWDPTHSRQTGAWASTW